MIDYNQAYVDAYDKLNNQQKVAVDTIDGPVMVVAGPGTGKTQLLAARIGRILIETDTTPSNILCLTFTDAGALAMRQRLLQFIGPTAYNVHIYTYHAFTNQIIQDNLEFFGGYLDLKKISDLEEVDIYQKLIDDFDQDHKLKRRKGDLYYYKPKLKNLFNTIKNEKWDPQIIVKAIDELKDFLSDQEAYTYKRNYSRNGVSYKKGDLNENKVKQEVDKYLNLRAASMEFENYQEILRLNERYDYQDMILWVIDQFSKNDALLKKYQERYHYVLVDEYQDTNGSQNQLIYQLADFWEEPNLFVVGDDDQSIYRFQGANMDNIVEFKEKYNPQIIVLEDNYRSGQNILDKATLLINNNNERLVSTESELVKNLIARNSEIKSSTVRYLKYYNTHHEAKGIINEILRLQEQGYPLSEVAIIYRKHKNVTDIIRYLQYKGVPLNVKQKVNILELPAVKQVISMLQYLEQERREPFSGDHLMFEILHFSFFEIAPKEIGKISLALYKKDKYWRDVVSDIDWLKEHGINEAEKIAHFSTLVEQWITDSANITIQTLLQKIFTESTMLDDILRSPNSTFVIQAVNSFFEFVKEECTTNPKLDLKGLIEVLEKMAANRLPISFMKIIHSNEGVNFITAHSAKGLEFEKVYMIRCEESNWVEKSNYNTQFSFPPNLIPSTDKSNIEDDRRLFFVAMTRAKTELIISYPGIASNEKEMDPCRFIEETKHGEDYEKISLPEDEIIDYALELMTFRKGKIQLIDHDLIDKVLKDYAMSVTHLNKYIRCPLSFYFESILRVPQARSSYIGYGNAVHGALYKFFNDIKDDSEFAVPDYATLSKYFIERMHHFRQHFTDKEFDNLSIHGNKNLKLYYDQNHGSWSAPRDYKLEHKIRDKHFEGIPIKGDLDKVVIHDDHLFVVDYKTGTHKSANVKAGNLEEEVVGGDYWRQIVFYKILIAVDPEFKQPMKYGTIDYIESKDDKFYTKSIEVSDKDLEVVRNQLHETYKSIHNHEFEVGCQDEKCRWCNLVADHINPLEWEKSEI